MGPLSFHQDVEGKGISNPELREVNPSTTNQAGVVHESWLDSRGNSDYSGKRPLEDVLPCGTSILRTIDKVPKTDGPHSGFEARDLSRVSRLA